ncbi:MAG: OB-fold domain-containing protein [Acidobacteriia bacterium]|nr:OB-fold domain-containing protein [Terriglobia bacterium]
MRSGLVYTETVIHSAAEAFASEVPFQTAIVTLDEPLGNVPNRIMGRVAGERVSIGDRVVEVKGREGVPFFQKI